MRRLFSILILFFTAIACGTGPVDADHPGDRDERSIRNRAGNVPYRVEVIRDSEGIPHFTADDLPSALYGLGYESARDRLFQMDFSRKWTQGRMSEWFAVDPVDAPAQQFNQKLLKHDQSMRVLGFARKNARLMALLDRDVRDNLEAFARGVNDFMASSEYQLPHGHQIMGLRHVEPWRPEDSLSVWDRVGILYTGMNIQTELDNYLACRGGCPAPRCGIEPPIDEDAAVVPAQDPSDWPPTYSTLFDELLGEEGIVLQGDGIRREIEFKASHGWVVAGSRTTTGKPVLATDPKVRIWAPQVFYPFHISAGDVDARGIGVAGAPGFLIFWNRFVSQTLTAAGGDVADLFRLTLGSGDTYVVDGQEIPFQHSQESILTRTGETHTVDVAHTIFGPVANLLLNNVPSGSVFAVKHLELSRTDGHSLVAAMDLMAADSLDSYRQALDEWIFPAAHALYGGVDRDDLRGEGHIAYHFLGGVPWRADKLVDGRDYRGRYPYDGSTLREDWQGRMSINEKPHVIDPASGYLFSANHLAVGSWYDRFGHHGMASNGDTFRSLILRYALDAALGDPRATMTPREVHALHFSAESTVLELYLNALSVLARSGRLDSASRDGTMTDGAKALAVKDALELWMAEGGNYALSSAYWPLLNALHAGPGGLVLQSRYANHPITSCTWNEAAGGVSFLLKAIDADPSVLGRDEQDLLVDVAALAWDAVMADGYDPDPAAWQPQPIEPTLVPYQVNLFCAHPGAAAKDLEKCQLDPAASFTVELDRAFVNTINSVIASSMPSTIDFSDVDNARSLVPPGVSENPRSPYFANMVDVWEAVGRGEDAMPVAPLSRDVIVLTADSVTTLTADR